MRVSTLSVFLQLLIGASSHTAEDVRRLIHDLFTNSSYDANIRPKWNQSEQTQVYLEMSISSINDFDVTTGEMAVSSYYTASWRDEFLVWNASDYGGLSKLILKPQQYWLPKLTLVHERNDGAKLMEASLSPAFLSSSGLVVWTAASNFYGKCTINTRLFPYDTHQCDFSVVLTQYDATEVTLIVPKSTIHLQNFKDHGEWRMVANRSRAVYSRDPDTGIAVWYAENLVQVERLPSFIMIHSLLPIIVVCFLNLLSFLVPVDCGERLSCSVTLFLAMVLQMSELVGSLPNNSNYISIYSSSLLVLNSVGTMSVVASIVFVRLSQRCVDEHPIPRCLKSPVTKFLLWRRGAGKMSVQSSRAKVVPLDALQVEDDQENPQDEEELIEVTWLQVTACFDVLLFAVNSTLVLTLIVAAIATVCIKYPERYNSFA